MIFMDSMRAGREWPSVMSCYEICADSKFLRDSISFMASFTCNSADWQSRWHDLSCTFRPWKKWTGLQLRTRWDFAQAFWHFLPSRSVFTSTMPGKKFLTWLVFWNQGKSIAQVFLFEDLPSLDGHGSQRQPSEEEIAVVTVQVLVQGISALIASGLTTTTYLYGFLAEKVEASKQFSTQRLPETIWIPTV